MTDQTMTDAEIVAGCEELDLIIAEVLAKVPFFEKGAVSNFLDGPLRTSIVTRIVGRVDAVRDAQPGVSA